MVIRIVGRVLMWKIWKVKRGLWEKKIVLEDMCESHDVVSKMS